ncbi:Uncharacterized protein FVE85_8764 [Porphyridium purpureum]|uniref:Histone deacetylase domain-containing protein n=1 Tax=Porphyridium purpureum TaxID=35688 RepID=A0A5J4YPF1_PORPP|nr:Uncharacterized protein FVE85_8764 [Porphyridium purpureum]|eukprot:POR2628..scf296_7
MAPQSARLSTRARSELPPCVYHRDYSVPDWPPNHRFVMSKFRDLRHVLQEQHVLEADEEHVPEMDRGASEFELCLAHDQEYVRRFLQNELTAEEMRAIGFTWSEALVRRTRLEVAGTVLASRLALHHGMACHLAGGTHHASAGAGAGFTILNDMAVAAILMLEELLVSRMLILDLDVHQGDGSARMLKDNPRVFTCSVHCADNYPLRKATSDLDIPLPAGTRDAEYMDCIQRYLPDLLGSIKPDLVLYDAGVDVCEHDRLGKLKLTEQGIYERDAFVLSACAQRGIPVVTVIGGGYDERWALARRHAIVHYAALDMWQKYIHKERNGAHAKPRLTWKPMS